MNTGAHMLGYAAAPPLFTPVRFFLTAPLFGLAAGVLLLLQPDLLASRWTPGALAITHLITVGFMLMVMVGALFQILPVVAGAAIPRVIRVAEVVHVALSAGAIALAWGLATMSPALLTWAVGLLGGGLGLFLLLAIHALWRVPTAQATPRDLLLAMIGLGIAIMLGLTISIVLARGLPLPRFELVKLHVGWAWLGGAGLLLAATSWMVVPMFQITPNYPDAMTRHWSKAMLVAVLAWSIAVMTAPMAVELGLMVGMLLVAALFPILTLKIQAGTRRARPDGVYRAFQFGMLSFIVGLISAVPASLGVHAFWPVACGILVLHGGFVSVISGMLYKIVPFLAWLNLNQARIGAPNMKKLLPEARTRRQLQVHACATAGLLLAALAGTAWITMAAALLVIAEFVLLGLNISGVAREYHRLSHPHAIA